MIALSLDAWVGIGGLAAATITILLGVFAQGRLVRTELKTDIQRVDDRVTALGSDLKSDIQRVDGRVTAFGTELKADLQRVESGLKADLQRVESGLKADIQRVESNLKSEIERVDDRVYALAAGLKPDIERAGEQRRGA